MGLPKQLVFLIWTVTVAVEGFNYYGGIGQPCSDRPGFRRYEGCDKSRGFTCQNYPEYGGFVCACPKSFAYDPHSDECRLRLGSNCIRPTGGLLEWFDKCQENAECNTGFTTRISGTCQCKPGFYLSLGGDYCEP